MLSVKYAGNDCFSKSIFYKLVTNSSRHLPDEPFLALGPHSLNMPSEKLGHHAHYVPTAAISAGAYAGAAAPSSSIGPPPSSSEPIAARFTGKG